MTHTAKLKDGKIESREPCPWGDESRVSDHCWHEITRTSVSCVGIQLVHLRCCFCGRPRDVRREARHPEGHGNYVPLELVQVSDTEDP
jgi:hypothetical protein